MKRYSKVYAMRERGYKEGVVQVLLFLVLRHEFKDFRVPVFKLHDVLVLHYTGLILNMLTASNDKEMRGIFEIAAIVAESSSEGGVPIDEEEDQAEGKE
jgi:hypothetical protein